MTNAAKAARISAAIIAAALAFTAAECAAKPVRPSRKPEYRLETWTNIPYDPPAVINDVDVPSAFMLDIHPHHNIVGKRYGLKTSPARDGAMPTNWGGSLTPDGYPVLLDADGRRWYIMPQGMVIHSPVIMPSGYPRGVREPAMRTRSSSRD